MWSLFGTKKGASQEVKGNVNSRTDSTVTVCVSLSLFMLPPFLTANAVSPPLPPFFNPPDHLTNCFDVCFAQKDKKCSLTLLR